MRRSVTGTVNNGLIWILIGCVVVVGVLGATYLRPLKGTVAVVNGRAITKAMLYDEMHKRVGQESLNNLIDSTIIMYEAAVKNLTLTDGELKAQTDRLIQKEYGSEEQFEDILSYYGLTRKQAEEEWKVYFTARKVVLAGIEMNDEVLEAFFEEYRTDFDKKESVFVRLMTLATEEDALGVLDELEAGGDFASIAKEKSLDFRTKDEGGEMGWVIPGDLDEELETVAFALEKGSLSHPVETAEGFVIVQVTDRTDGEAAVFSEVKDEVRELYEDFKVQETLPAWLEELRSRASVQYK